MEANAPYPGPKSVNRSMVSLSSKVPWIVGMPKKMVIGLISSFIGTSGPDVNGPESSAPLTISSDNNNALAPSVKTEANPSTEHDSTITPRARVVIFSKDRPWQLQQLLMSMKLRSKDSSRHTCLLHNCNIHIILRASTTAYKIGYEKVMHAHEYDGVNFLIEDDQQTEATSFSSLLEQALTVDTSRNEDTGVVMFLTDDCLFLEPIEDALEIAIFALQHGTIGRERVFNFLSRLHPGISWCQTRGVACPPPRDEMKYQSLAQYFANLHREGEVYDAAKLHDGVYLYDRKRCSGEWAYLFDLSGGVYRHCDVLALLKNMETEQRNHPNVLETRINKLLKDTTVKGHPEESLKSLSAIPSRPMLVILAINRVQDVYHAPLALPQESTYGTILMEGTKMPPINPRDPESLLGLLDEDCHLDSERYKTTIYNSSHIGDFFIEPLPAKDNHLKEVDHSSTHPKLSILMPVHCSPPYAASHSILSIIMQPIEEFHMLCKVDKGVVKEYHKKALLSPMQVVLVDDRCNDGSIDAMIKACDDLVKSHEDVVFTMQDHRSKGTPKQKDLVAGDRCVSISLDIVPSPRAGVASALNHGLSYCRANIVARMDADDISSHGRLLSQIRYMRANPSIDAAGTSTVLFSENRATNRKRDSLILPYSDLIQNTEPHYILRPSLSISDPGFMAWAMFFTCCISHPSVIYRKNAVQELGGYGESTTCEDYDLWLRLLNRNSRSIVCLPFLGLWHRKHSQSSSSAGSTIQKDEADNASFAAMQRMFHSTTSDDGLLMFDHVSTLRNPNSATSPQSLEFAAKLLLRLESSFMEKNSEYLSHEERTLIQSDCNARIGEIATLAQINFGNKGSEDKSFLWKLWCERCPDKQLERLSLLCHMHNITN
ncbi:hypothetical protein ACHAXR_012212 [Thalassiosira sp. AJA248-18]